MNRLSFLLLLLSLCSASSVAHAQSTRLNRCTDTQGQSVYRPALRQRRRPITIATARARRQHPAARHPGGARRLSELVEALRTGIVSNDVNRLSSLYLWGAVSDAGAQRILGQLESLARRPLVDVVPVYPSLGLVASQEDGQSAAAQESDPEPPAARHPIGLRLEQTLPGGVSRASTVLGLRRQYGCFWITL